MYYFTIGGLECRCETAEELQAVAERPVSTLARATATTRAKARRGRRAKSHHRRSPEATEVAATETGKEAGRNSKALKDSVPYLEGGITWDVAKKQGKKLGRTDIRQLRSDLKQRQLIGK